MSFPTNRELRNPASLSPEDREAFRLAFVGNLGDVERKDIAGGVVFLSETGGKHYAIGFAGKAARPAFNLYFKIEQHRAEYVARWEAGLLASEKAKAARRAERKADKHGLCVGSILYSSWGYEQSNIDYYQVVALVGEKMVEIREIASDEVSDGVQAMTGRVMPVPNQFVGPVMRKKATSHGVRITSFSGAHLWDGRAKYVSSYA